MIKPYIALAALTAIHLWLLNRPKGLGEWLAFAAFVACWPVILAFALYCAVARVTAIAIDAAKRARP